MRRTLTVGFLVGALAAGFALCTHFGRRPTAPEAPEAGPPRAAPDPPPPRLAPPPTASLDVAPATPPQPPPGAAEEGALLQQIRALVKTDPPRAEALARESRRRFPDGTTADERDALLVDALINQQRIGAARDETYYYFDHHPGGRFGEHLFIMTGVQPRPKGPAR
jgi:hypothetical protein